jgi:hypothetical protein
MSRLDDELRNAFRREQPPADFAARVLEQVARQPAPRPPWWRRLVLLVEPPKLRWVALGITASLLLAIAGTQYGKLRQVVVNDDGKISKNAPHSEDTSKSAVDPGSRATQPVVPSEAPKSPQNLKRVVSSSTNHRTGLSRRERDLRTEAQAAKQKLMLALYIASATLNDAQKAIHDDVSKP